MTRGQARKIIQFTLTDWSFTVSNFYQYPLYITETFYDAKETGKIGKSLLNFQRLCYGQNFHKYSLCFLSWTHSKLRLYWPVRTSESPDLTNPSVSKIVADHYLSWGHLYLTTNCPQLPNVPQSLHNPGSQSSLNLKYIRHFIFIVNIFLLALRLENSNRFERPYIKMI